VSRGFPWVVMPPGTELPVGPRVYSAYSYQPTLPDGLPLATPRIAPSIDYRALPGKDRTENVSATIGCCLFARKRSVHRAVP
jgi:hypothetical protein